MIKRKKNSLDSLYVSCFYSNLSITVRIFKIDLAVFRFIHYNKKYKFLHVISLISRSPIINLVYVKEDQIVLPSFTVGLRDVVAVPS